MNGDRPRLGWIVWLAAATAACAALWTVLTYRPTSAQMTEAIDESDQRQRESDAAVSGGEDRIKRYLRNGRVDDALMSADKWVVAVSDSIEANYWASYLYATAPGGPEMSFKLARRGMHLSAEAIQREPEEPRWHAFRGWFERLTNDGANAIGSFERAVELQQAQEPLALGRAQWEYNLACYLSLAGRVNDAIEHLGRAVESGWIERQQVGWLRVDPDLDALREHDGYAALLVRIDEIRFIAESAPVESPSVSDNNRAAEREAARQRAGAGAK